MNRTRWPCWAVVVAASTLAAWGDSGTEPPAPEPPANRAPEVRGSIPDQALTPGGPAATVDVANNFADPDGDALSYAVSSSNGGVAAASISGTVVTVQPVALGTAMVTVTARDADGLTASLSFAVSSSASPGTVMWVAECVDPVEGESDTDNNCSAALKLAIAATGGLRAAGVPVAQRPRRPDSGVPTVLVGVVRPAGQIKFGPVARSSRLSPAGAKRPPR